MISKRSLGEHLYLYSNKEAPAASTLLITAHGCFFTDENNRLHLPFERTSVPIGTTLGFFSRHGQSASANISLANYLMLMPMERVYSGQVVYNYRLSKYRDDNDAYIMSCLKYPGAPNVDILAIRNRWTNKLGTSLADVFNALRNNGLRYVEIRCAFCRSPVVGPEYS